MEISKVPLFAIPSSSPHPQGYKNSISVESRDILIYDIKSKIYELPRYDCNEIKKLHPII